MKSIRVKLKFKEYEFFPDKILFKTKVYLGRIKVHPTLENFAYLDKAYVKVNNELKVVKLHQYLDRRTRQLNGYVSIKMNHKVVDVYVKTIPEFATILKTALASEQKLSDLFRDGTRIYVNSAGKLLLKLLVTSASGTKSHSEIHNLLEGRCKSTYLETLLDFIKNTKVDECLLTPFVENYYVAILKKELKFPKEPLLLPKNVYRVIGLINGDGHLSKVGVYFYNTDKELHRDFKLGINIIDPDIRFKEKQLYNGMSKTYVYSADLARKLYKLGAIMGNKLLVNNPVNIENNFYAITEYLGGIYDTEGSFTRDNHVIIISNCASIKRNEVKLYNELTENEYEYILGLAKSYGVLRKTPCGYKYHHLGLKPLKTDSSLMAKKILDKSHSIRPVLLITIQNILDKLGINACTELKSFLIYPGSADVNTVWWVKISSVEDIIKFLSVVHIHSKEKRKVIRSFVRDYVSKNDFFKIKDYIKDSLGDIIGN